MADENTPQAVALTEAEYVAWAKRRMQEILGDFTAALPDWAREAGMRIEQSTEES